MTNTFLNPSELIPGYSTIDRIGGGGYGEVWRVKAPGGLDKAIKVVYGYINEERASREFKALNRIKEIRHPFLLSLERIEIVANQLLIVTELADHSLIERFDECREKGLEGIPRDDLIQYLRDAAAALDYMLEKNSLQHLDIKPENLLLVGERIKVADFGLVKDVSESAHSTVLGGLTPVYASPEVFNGAASPQSDQYSLAIVYQHMLTGILPFPGRTQQQLSIQHKQATPRLSSLPESDRGAVARALMKEPSERFSSCEDFVEALANGVRSTVVRHRTSSGRPAETPSREQDTTSQKGAETTFAPSENRSGTDSNDVYKTEQLDQQINRTKLRELAKSLAGDTPAVPVTTEIREHGPVEASEIVAEVRPTLFIGVGGTGARVLQRLKSRLVDWNAFEKSDAVQLLLLDTDGDTVKAAREGAHGAPLDRDEVLGLSLRRPREYQERSAQLMRWISRRWLYNIPRSLKPQGYRPLGRLAWVDHVERVHVTLRDRLARLVHDDSIKALEEASGQPCSDRSPRIFIVGSTSGGTGGGILLDAMQTVRFLLAELDIPHDGITSLLTYSTNGHPRESTLAVANTYAFLSELQHLAKLPADDPCIDPRIVGTGLTPLPPTYFVNLGEHLGDEGFDDRVSDVGDYLYCNVATSAASVLDRIRGDSETVVDNDVKLRSIGLSSLEIASCDLPNHWTKLLCQSVLYRWLDFDDEPNVELPQIDEMINTEFNDWAPTRFVGCLSRFLTENCLEALMPVKPGKEPDLTPLASLACDAARQLRGLVADFELPTAEGAVLPHANAPEIERRSPAAVSRLGRNLDRQLRATIPLIADDLSESLLPKFLGSGAVEPGGNTTPFQSLSTLLCSAAQAAIAAAVREVDDEHVVDDQGCLRPTSEKLNECFDPAVIRLPGCGLARRLFVLDRAGSGWLDQESVCRNATMVSGAVDQTVVCQEAEEISLAQLAYMLADGRPEIVEAAIRLHTRTDVKWSYPAPIRQAEASSEE